MSLNWGPCLALGMMDHKTLLANVTEADIMHWNSKRGDEVDFDTCFHDRNGGSSWICKFTRKIDVALRHVIY